MENMPSGQTKLGECEGDCDKDSDCASGLVCFQRDSSSDVPPGCKAGGSGDKGTHDYCAALTRPFPLVNLGGSKENMAPGQKKLRECEGDCDKDSDCASGMVCYQRDTSSDVPRGCQAGGAGDLGTHDYCVQAPKKLVDLGGSMENMPSGQTKLGECEGDCDKDSDCASGLVCFQRDSSSDVPPGCKAGGSGDKGTHDYCAALTRPFPLVNLGGSKENMAPGQKKLRECEGDCDKDSDCASGMVCYQRDTSSDVPPGCQAGGSGDLGTHDYCVYKK